MKYLNIIDLVVQTIILGLVTLISVPMIFMGQLESIGMIAMYGAIFLGPWQLVSSLLTVISKGLYFRWRVIHLLSAVGYLGAVSLYVALFANADIDGVLKTFLFVLGFGIPTGLAVFYYYITFKSFQLPRAQSKVVA